MDGDGRQLAEAYYRTIDTGDYGTLSSLLAERFVHDRPDRTLSGREQFLTFMRTERPETDTDHVVETVYVTEDRVAVEGRLLFADGTEWFRFVDTFEIDDGRISAVTTYTDA